LTGEEAVELLLDGCCLLIGEEAEEEEEAALAFLGEDL